MVDKCVFEFTPDPDCDNCDGTGVFSVDEDGHPLDPCHFCMTDAILRGEINGSIDGVEYVKGKRMN